MGRRVLVGWGAPAAALHIHALAAGGAAGLGIADLEAATACCTSHDSLRPQFVADEAGQLVALGSGTHGDVFLARLDSLQVAVKVSCLVGRDASTRALLRESGRSTCLLVGYEAHGSHAAVAIAPGSTAVLLLPSKLHPSAPPCAQVIELGVLLNPGRVWQEVGLLRRANHPRIVKLLGVGMEVSAAWVHVVCLCSRCAG